MFGTFGNHFRNVPKLFEERFKPILRAAVKQFQDVFGNVLDICSERFGSIVAQNQQNEIKRKQNFPRLDILVSDI